jgi:branched-chain amino acid transport system substrate-binding protein
MKKEPLMNARPALLTVSAALLIAAAVIGRADAQATIKIGDINSYKLLAANLEPYRKGIDLALADINGSGGLLGKKVEVIARDDGANPGKAVSVAEALLTEDKVDFLTGTILSNVGLAIADYARHRKVFFLASAPLTDKMIWGDGNRYTFRLRPTTYSHAAALIPYAAALKRKRWAFVYPNYEYGQSAVATFKRLLKKAQPDVEFVADQAAPLGKIDAGAVVEALNDAKPDAIFNVLFGSDLAKFVRQGSTRGLFGHIKVVSLLTGEPEYLDPLKSDAPVGWYATGYPWYSVKAPAQIAFVKAYQKRYHDYPRMASLVGFTMMKAIAAGIKKAGSTNSEKLVDAFEGLSFNSPFGKQSFRAIDHQSTIGLFVGPIGLRDGKGIMTSYKYIDGAKLLPPDAEVLKLRVAKSQ